MTESMTLIERLNNPNRGEDGTLTDAVNIDAMRLAASEIARLRSVIDAYLAERWSCNGGAQMMFEAAIRDCK